MNALTVKLELLGEVNMYVGLGIQTLVAVILGFMIGIDREKKLKSAGIKTHILICLGATLYSSIALLNLQNYGQAPDPNRMAAQIVSGIGFLGAGAIIQGKGSIFGLTTAAGIWVVAAVGVAIGSGFPISAVFFTLIILAVLRLLVPFYRKLEPEGKFHLEVISNREMQDSLEHVLQEEEATVLHQEYYFDGVQDRGSYHFYLQTSPQTIKKILFNINQFKSVKLVNYKAIKDVPNFI